MFFDAFPLNGALTVNGDDAGRVTNDTIAFRRIRTNRDFVSVRVNNRIQYAGLATGIGQGLTVNGRDGDDTLIVDFRPGNPLQGLSLTYDGGTGTNTIVANALGSYILSDSSLEIVGQGIVLLDSVQGADLTAGPGNDTFTFSDWTGTARLNGGRAGRDKVVITCCPIASDRLQIANIQEVEIDGGSFVVNSAFLVDSVRVRPGGTLELAGSTLTVPGGVRIDPQGTLTGSGSIIGNVVNGGEVDPGGTGAAGRINITGDYEQKHTGILNIEIRGLRPITEFDQLNIFRVVTGGTARLDGTLNVSLLNGFNPAVGTTFEIMSFAMLLGDFANKSGLTFDAKRFDARYLPPVIPQNLTLVVVATKSPLTWANDPGQAVFSVF